MSGVRLRRKFLQAADALAGEFVHSPHKVGRRGGDVVIKPGVDLQDPRRLAGPESGLKLRAVDKRNLAEEIARQAHSKLALDAVDEFDDFDCAFEHDKERWRFALIDRVLSRIQVDVRSRPFDVRQSDWRKRGKDRNRGKFVWRQHALPALVARREKCGRLLWGRPPLCQAADVAKRRARQFDAPPDVDPTEAKKAARRAAFKDRKMRSWLPQAATAFVLALR